MTENFGKGKNKEHLYRIPIKENAILPGVTKWCRLSLLTNSALADLGVLLNTVGIQEAILEMYRTSTMATCPRVQVTRPLFFKYFIADKISRNSCEYFLRHLEVKTCKGHTAKAFTGFFCLAVRLTGIWGPPQRQSGGLHPPWPGQGAAGSSAWGPGWGGEQGFRHEILARVSYNFLMFCYKVLHILKLSLFTNWILNS